MTREPMLSRPSLDIALARYPTIQVSRLALREGNRKRPVYTMHKWWARRLGAVFRMILLAERRRTKPRGSEELWSAFYSPAEQSEEFTVLDPFLGGGTTLIEASKQGAKCIGVDIDPVACFITEMELAPIAAARVEVRYKEIAESVGKELGHFYKTTRRGAVVDVVHYFWVDVITCATCRMETDAHPTFQLAYDTDTKRQTVVCPACYDITECPMTTRWHRCGCGHTTDLKAPPVSQGVFVCPECGATASVASLSAECMVTPRLFALEYLSSRGERGFQRVEDVDLLLYQRAVRSLAQRRGSLPLPKAFIPVSGRSDRRPIMYGFLQYQDLFNARQLLGLGVIAKAIKETQDREIRRALALAFSHALASNNMFCGWAFGYRRLTPLFGVHSFRKVTRPVEGNLLGLKIGRGSFANAVRSVVRGYEYMAEPFEYRYEGSRPTRVPIVPSKTAAPTIPRAGVRILNRSSIDLSPVKDKSVHLVLTDPPYFDNLSYSELSDFYHVWLRTLLGADYVGDNQAHTPIGASLFGGKRRALKRSWDPKKKYISTLTRVFKECRRVLRDEGALVFTFHHKSADAWEGLGRALLAADFFIEEVVPVRSEGCSGFHSYKGTIKWDSIFFCLPGRTARTKTPTPRAAAAAAQRANNVASIWATRILRSRFEFSAADRLSLAMSLVLREFAQKRLDPQLLSEAIVKLSGLNTGPDL